MNALTEVSDNIGVIRINNPERKNALTPELIDSIRQALHELSNRRTIRCAILTGVGDTFSSGADLGSVLPYYDEGQRPPFGRYLNDHYNPLVTDLVDGPLPVVAAVDGVAAGAGLGLALACDVRVVSERAWFKFAFADVGLAPDSGISYFLPRLIGTARAIDVALLRDRITAEEAVELGLAVKRVVPQSLEEEARKVAARVASLPTLAVRRTRQLFEYGMSRSLAEVLNREAVVQSEVGASADHLEGIRAFTEKRQPVFNAPSIQPGA